MKKLLCIIAIILAVVGFSACKGGNNGGDNNLNTVTVTLDLDGGVIDGDTTYYAVPWKDLSIPNPTKEGYDFNGWTHNGTHVSLKPFMIEKDVTLVATWKVRTYDVRLDFNGGYLIENGETITQKNTNATFKDSVDFPTPLREGYKFIGWYYGEQEVHVNSWGLDVGSVIIKARWARETYQVKFDFNGGTLVGGDVSLAEKTITVEYSRTFELPIVKKQGYTFKGWAFEGENPIKSNVWTYDKDGVLYATFEPITINYVFDAVGGTASASEGDIRYGENTSAIKSITAQKAGHVFNGWLVNGVELGSEFNYLPKSNRSVVVLTASYTAKTYRLTLNAGNGAISGETFVDVVYGKECDIPVPTAPDGSLFIGWQIKNGGEIVSSNKGKITWLYEKSEELQAVYDTEVFVNFIQPDGSVECVSRDYLVNSNFENMPVIKAVAGYTATWDIDEQAIASLTETAEVKAILTENTYVVTFISDSTKMGIRNYIYSRPATLPNSNEIKKGGYILLGWSVDPNGKTDYMSGTVIWNIDSNINLYAVWERATYNVTYDVSTINLDYTLSDGAGNIVGNVQGVTYGQVYKLYEIKTKDNVIKVTWLYKGSEFKSEDVWSLKYDVILTPKIIYNNVKIEVNLNLDGGSGATIVTFTLGKNFNFISHLPTPPKGKKLIGYSYKGETFAFSDLFLIADYDGTPIKCLYKEVIEFAVKIDYGEGIGRTTGVIVYGMPLSSINPRPSAPNGKKLVGFMYKGKQYSLSYVWDLTVYDGSILTAIYEDDNADWSPTV